MPHPRPIYDPGIQSFPANLLVALQAFGKGALPLHSAGHRAMDGVAQLHICEGHKGGGQDVIRSHKGWVMAEIPADSRDQANVVTSRDEWERVAGVWPLKRLVAIWNALPGVTPVEKFTSKQIAVERIWRAIESPEKAQAKADGKRKQTKVRFREGSKAAQVYALLCRPEGATVRDIQDLTGWQRHSVRGFLSASVRKQGRSVRFFERQGERVYRVKS